MNSHARKFLLGLGVLIAVIPALTITSARAAPTNVSSVAKLMPPPLNDISMGNPKAKVTMVEYASTACRRCARFSNEIFPALKKDYIDTGKVRFVFREFPYDDLAMVTFMLLRCASENQYFPLIKVLYKRQQSWERRPHELHKIFKANGFSEKKFNACLNDKKLLNRIKDGVLRAEKVLHVNSTPTFFINGKKVVGTQPIGTFKAMIDAAL